MTCKVLGYDVRGRGTCDEIRATPGLEQVFAAGRAPYAEMAAQGLVYCAMTAVGGTTVVAANNSPVGAAAASILSLYNPLNSGVRAEVLKAWIVFVSGTPGAGAFVFNSGFNQTITASPNNTGTASLMPTPAQGNGMTGKVKAFTQTALTGSTAQVPVRPITGAFAGALAASSPVTFLDIVDGELIVPMGGVLSIASPVAGTSCIVVAGITYAEIPC